MEAMLWNAILSFVSGLLLWFVKVQWDEIKRISILLSKTREEHSDKFVTKADMHNDVNRVIQRLDRLDEKFDAFMKEQRSALN